METSPEDIDLQPGEDPQEPCQAGVRAAALREFRLGPPAVNDCHSPPQSVCKIGPKQLVEQSTLVAACACQVTVQNCHKGDPLGEERKGDQQIHRSLADSKWERLNHMVE